MLASAPLSNESEPLPLNRNMSDPHPPLLLTDALAKNHAIAVVGSGLSLAAGAPSWRNLLLSLAFEAQRTCTDKLDDVVAAVGEIQHGRLLDAASLLKKAMGHAQFTAVVRRSFRQRHQISIDADARRLGGPLLREEGQPAELRLKSTAAHRMLVRLGFRAIVTTNYDRLLEYAWPEQAPSYSWGYSHLLDRIRDQSTFILKLHGDICHPEELVLAREDYGPVIARVEQALMVLFGSACPFWVGYGHNDPDLDLIKDRFRSGLGASNNGIGIISEADPHRPALSQHFQSVGLTQVCLADYDALPSFLRRLATELDKPLVFTVGLEASAPGDEDVAQRRGHEFACGLRRCGFEVDFLDAQENPPRFLFECAAAAWKALRDGIANPTKALRTLLKRFAVKDMDGISVPPVFESRSPGGLSGPPTADVNAPPSSVPSLQSDPARPLRKRSGSRLPKFRFPTSFSFEDLLHELVTNANEQLLGDGCSVFMRDPDAGAFVLRESTLLSSLIGRYALDPPEQPSEACGITSLCLARKEPYLSPDVHTDRWWSSYARADTAERQRNEHCELSRERMKSIIAVPILRGQEPEGVIRVVRSVDRDAFNEEDLTKLQGLVAAHGPTLFEAMSFRRLMELGTALTEENLCQEAVDILSGLVRAETCALFLRGDAKRAKGRYRYRCIATATGLEKQRQPVDARNEYYELPNDLEDGRATAYVLDRKRNLFIDDMHTYDFSQLEIGRASGSGKVSDSVPNVREPGVQRFMAAPLLFRERLDPELPAMGAIRVGRGRGANVFSLEDRRRFLSFVEQLSRGILRCRYHGILRRLATSRRSEPLQAHLDRLVAEALPLFGGSGCSIFLGRPLLRLRATFGKLESAHREGRVQPYDLTVQQPGYTLWCARNGKPVRFNSGMERARLAEEHGIMGSGRGECEIDGVPARFLVVPIRTTEGETIGAMRVPKTANQSLFTADDETMAASIADHLGALLETRRSANQRDDWTDPD